MDYINAANGWDFFSREAATVPRRPKVTVTYSGAPTAVELDSNEVPDGFKLEGNYPNPFNPSTVIVYALPEAIKVQITVYDALASRIPYCLMQRQERVPQLNW